MTQPTDFDGIAGTVTGCTCAVPGFCHRHGIDKRGRLWELCRSRIDYFQMWESGRYYHPAIESKSGASGPRRKDRCIYLGAIRSRTDGLGRECACPQKWLRACELHAQCTIASCGRTGVPNCIECSDYESDVIGFSAPTAQKLILSCTLSPGDIVVMTAAVRELHRQHPGEFVTDVRTPCPAIWENNPHLTPLDDADRMVRHISMHYDGGQGSLSWADINRSNQHPAHFLCGYAEHLGAALGLAPLRPTEFKGDIHLTPLEKSWMSQVQEIRGEPTRFWLINAGGKNDYTAKIWPPESFQQVVDHFQGRLTFVQVGEQGHTHPKLDGVIDLRGKTDLRQLIRLVYHSSGILCGVTLLMHLAAAVESPPWVPGLRPCVVLGGGREPPHWEAYPGHQFLHTIGALPCCAWGGCWRSRTVPLGDGSEQDLSLCERPVDGSPECLRMITPEKVIEAIEMYQRTAAAVPAEA